ncbi:hypothetical protein Tco_0791051 [Tanacetum coccineum]
MDWRASTPKDEMPTAGSNLAANVDGLAHEEPPKEPATTTEVAQEAVLEEEVAVVRALGNKRRKQLRRKRANEEVEVNVSPKVLRRDHASGLTHSTAGGKSLASMGLEAGTPIPTPLETPVDVSDPDPLSYAKSQSILEQDVVQSSRRERPLERITKKRTKNKAKTTKPNMEWKSCKGQSQSKAKDQKSQSQSQLNKLTVKTGAVIEEYYWMRSQPI